MVQLQNNVTSESFVFQPFTKVVAYQLIKPAVSIKVDPIKKSAEVPVVWNRDQVSFLGELVLVHTGNVQEFVMSYMIVSLLCDLSGNGTHLNFFWPA